MASEFASFLPAKQSQKDDLMRLNAPPMVIAKCFATLCPSASVRWTLKQLAKVDFSLLSAKECQCEPCDDFSETAGMPLLLTWLQNTAQMSICCSVVAVTELANALPSYCGISWLAVNSVMCMQTPSSMWLARSPLQPTAASMRSMASC